MSRSRQFSLESVIPSSGKSQLAYYYEVPNGLEGGVVKTVLFVFQRIRIFLALLSDEREEIKDWANYKHRRHSRGTLALLAPNFVSIARRKKRLLAAYNLGRFGPQTRGGGRE